MLSFEEEGEGDEEDDEVVVDELVTGGPTEEEGDDFESINNNIVVLRKKENSMEMLSRKLANCWNETYFDSPNNNDEKIYEDLCYVTFSSSSREVL